MAEEECVFCGIVGKKIPAKMVEESENFIAFPDANPITKGHTLIIPKKHFVNLMDMPSDLVSEMIDLVKKIAEEKLRQGFEGFNLFMNNFPAAGQLVMHAHLHFVPRKKGDGIKFRL